MATLLGSTSDLGKLRKQILAEEHRSKPVVTVCCGTGCQAYGSQKVMQAFVDEMERQGLAGKVMSRGTGCHGFCERGVVVILFPEEICYLGVKPDDVPEIVSKTLIGKEIVERLTYEDIATGQRCAK